MKPKHLKCPFSWNERQPLILNRVLFVPQYYDRHEEFVFPGWEDPSLFGKAGDVYVEYCAGNGAWILERALKNPTQLWVAVEKKFERVRKIWSKIQNYELDNLIVVCGEALTFTKFYLPSDSIAEAFVNFPDPWPKDRHAKHRLIQQPFVQELERVIKPKGGLTLVTDDVDYSEQMIQEMSPWISSFPEPYYRTDWDGYGTSYFDNLWREKGRTIRYLQYMNPKSEL